MMAVIHETTLTPTKLELLRDWLPAQDWFRGERVLELHRAGGFRLDDPDGAVGMECILVTDTAAAQTYHVPMTYRGAPLESAGAALIGTTEHGVLGRRWIYDGAHDPVLLAQALALLTGRVQAQDQNVSNTADPSINIILAETDAPITVRINRIPAAGGEPGTRCGYATGSWRTPQGTQVRGVLLEAVAVQERN